MFIYFRTMRQKDELKQEALLQATVKLVNEIGFVASSVSKIAKEAGVSPATVYIYYKNKEDLLVSTYISIKLKMGNAINVGIDLNAPIRDSLKQAWHNMFAYVSANSEQFQFAEQFSNSPFADLVDKSKLEATFAPLTQVIQRGIEQKIIKDVSIDILSAFIFFPVFSLANPRYCKSFGKKQDEIDLAFTLAWDAIKL